MDKRLKDFSNPKWVLDPNTSEPAPLDEAVANAWVDLVSNNFTDGFDVYVSAHFGEEAVELYGGAFSETDPRQNSRKTFDARLYADLLAEMPTLVGPIAMRDAMGATRQELKSLTEEGGHHTPPYPLAPNNRVCSPNIRGSGLTLRVKFPSTEK